MNHLACRFVKMVFARTGEYFTKNW